MAMTVAEAAATNTLLRHLLRADTGSTPSDDELRAAARTLARAAYRRLAAGVRPEDVDAARRPDPALYAITRRDGDQIAGRPLTDGEAERIRRALPQSSIPDAVDTVVASITAPD